MAGSEHLRSAGKPNYSAGIEYPVVCTKGGTEIFQATGHEPTL